MVQCTLYRLQVRSGNLAPASTLTTKEVNLAVKQTSHDLEGWDKTTLVNHNLSTKTLRPGVKVVLCGVSLWLVS